MVKKHWVLVALAAGCACHRDTRTAHRMEPCRPAPIATHQLRQLRGGATTSLVETVKGAYLSVPVVTRSWLSLCLSLAAVSQAGLLNDELFSVDAALIARKFQLWRPLTAASFFGGVGPQLLQKLYYLVTFGKGLELALGVGEYMRAIASCVATLTFLSHLVGWPFLGDGVIMAVTVLCVMQSPGQQTSMYGLTIPLQFLPFAQLIMSYIFTQQIPWQDMMGLFVGFAHYLLNDNLKADAAYHQKHGPPKETTRGARTIGGGGGSGGGAGGRTGTSARSSKPRKPRINQIKASCSTGG